MSPVVDLLAGLRLSMRNVGNFAPWVLILTLAKQLQRKSRDQPIWTKWELNQAAVT